MCMEPAYKECQFDKLLLLDELDIKLKTLTISIKSFVKFYKVVFKNLD